MGKTGQPNQEAAKIAQAKGALKAIEKNKVVPKAAGQAASNENVDAIKEPQAAPMKKSGVASPPLNPTAKQTMVNPPFTRKANQGAGVV